MTTKGLHKMLVVTALIWGNSWAWAQSASKPSSGKASGPEGSASKESGAKEGEKLDLSDLEQKYWAPKDTDFTVVQNRAYTKAKRYAATYMLGPIVNDPFNSGFNHQLNVNYYFDERYGVELIYQTSKLSDSDATKHFMEFAGGGTRPDFNREKSFYGVGVNWVPFYAKMSLLGFKIIYFDMQVTPFVGMTTYEQQSAVKTPDVTTFAYGLSVTQFFFFNKNFAVRAELHNRFYKSDVLAYTNGVGFQAGDVRRSGESTNTSMFLMGVTYFY